MLDYMGYTDKLQRLCELRGLDQSILARTLKLSKSSVSRIFSGKQEPKVRLAFDLAKALGVTLDYLLDDSPEVGASHQLVVVTDDEMTILRVVRKLGAGVALDRLLNIPDRVITEVPRGEPIPPTPTEGL
jgi:transcriptional regulator with XRE-family HTH domain